jgi:hypothetical protein
VSTAFVACPAPGQASIDTPSFGAAIIIGHRARLAVTAENIYLTPRMTPSQSSARIHLTGPAAGQLGSSRPTREQGANDK